VNDADTSTSDDNVLASITFRFQFVDRYKSLSGSLIWENVPPFAVLTGLNGSGKTQLLEALAARLAGMSGVVDRLGGAKLEVVGESFKPEEVAFIPSSGTFSQGVSLGLSQLQDFRPQMFTQLTQAGWNKNPQRVIRRGIIERYLKRSLKGMTQEDFLRELPEDLAFMLDEKDVTSGLAYVFIAYRVRSADEREKGTNEDQIREKLGPPPWELVNEVLARSNFPYRINSPTESSFLAHYQLKFRSASGNAINLNPGDLSSGEKTLLQVVLWMYNAQHHSRFPKIFLLDEPDAHLHPSYAQHFIEVLREILVKKHRIRVILTTHSASTVALAPNESLFEMWSDNPRIRSSKSKAETIGLLTAGLVTVSPSTRFVVVEDDSDVDFYSAIRDLLTDYGPSCDSRALAAAPSMVFLPASIGSGKTKTSGGNTIVAKWIGKFDQPPLTEIFRGIVDLDSGAISTDRIFTIGRYNIENYLLDPLLIFGLLSELALAPAIPGVSITSGDEHRIRGFSIAQLQAIVDAVCLTVASRLNHLTSIETSKNPVEFTNGKRVQYPNWMLSRNGHDLMGVFQSLFGGAKCVNPPRLINTLKRVRMLPVELAAVLHSVQK